ncbi:hypothetical protein TNCV_309931 [Trichonephila clavipes]|nr:hypothetical protein TNCV_309931 [Trichonephila clavipes]
MGRNRALLDLTKESAWLCLFATLAWGSNSSSHQALKCLTLKPLVTILGDISAAECLFENGQTVISVVVYISSNKTVKKIKDYLHFVFLRYNEGGSALLKNYHSLLLILSGDFNFNFSLPEAEQLIAFTNDEFKVEMNTNQNVSTANSGTVLDALFFNGF